MLPPQSMLTIKNRTTTSLIAPAKLYPTAGSVAQTFLSAVSQGFPACESSVMAKRITFERLADRNVCTTLKNLLTLGILAFAITGCRPPGPRALLDGQRLIDQGKYPQAV